MAITDSTASIPLNHNHPSRDPTPSVEDIRITGKPMELRILDHVMLGRGEKRFVSLREAGLVEF